MKIKAHPHLNIQSILPPGKRPRVPNRDIYSATDDSLLHCMSLHWATVCYLWAVAHSPWRSPQDSHSECFCTLLLQWPGSSVYRQCSPICSYSRFQHGHGTVLFHLWEWAAPHLVTRQEVYEFRGYYIQYSFLSAVFIHLTCDLWGGFHRCFLITDPWALHPHLPLQHTFYEKFAQVDYFFY